MGFFKFFKDYYKLACLVFKVGFVVFVAILLKPVFVVEYNLRTLDNIGEWGASTCVWLRVWLHVYLCRYVQVRAWIYIYVRVCNSVCACLVTCPRMQLYVRSCARVLLCISACLVICPRVKVCPHAYGR